MKKLFQVWLLLFVGLAFAVTLGASWWIHSKLARASALEILRLKLDDAKRQLVLTRNNLHSIRAMTDAASLAKARAFAQIVAADPMILSKPDDLEKVRRSLDVDELHVSDEKGILIAAIPHAYLGFDMSKAEQSAAFLPAIRDPKFALVQDPRPNGIRKILFQYAGVARIDAPGLVQIGCRPERFEKAMKLADIDKLASLIRIGNNGILRIERNSRILPDRHERVFRETVNGKPSLCLSVVDGDYILTGNLPEDEMYFSRDSVIRILVVGNLILFAVIFLLVTALLQKVVIKGIYSVNDTLGKITEGDLNERIDVHTTAEFNVLSSGINATVDALKKAIENEAGRIDAELETGRTIQASVLPSDFPDNDRFRIRAAMFTAKEVGGDFFDFFPVGENRQAVLIADVSGKGITAALYMMTAKTLLKELIQTGRDPAEAIHLANQELCRNNQAHMFLSVFLAVLDTGHNTLSCVNAGHNPPLWKHSDSDWEFLRIKHSLVLGASKKARYQTVLLEFRPGDRLLLYTDGVTEAMNSAHEQYGETRFRDFCRAFSGSAETFLSAIRAELDGFAVDVPQSDDITMLTLDFRSPLKNREHEV